MKIAEHYGYEAQSRQLIEEMAELTQAINHLWRIQNGFHAGPGTPNIDYDETVTLNDLEKYAVDRIAEEIADVEIMLKQVKYLMMLSKGWLKSAKRNRIARQLKRIEEEET